MCFLRKFIFLLIITDFFTLAPSFNPLNAAEYDGIYAVDQDYNKGSSYKNGNEKNKTIPQQFDVFKALIPYLAASGVGIVIIGALFLGNTEGAELLGKQETTTPKVYPSKQLTAEVMITEAQPLSTLKASEFNTVRSQALTSEEYEKFKDFITRPIFKKMFKIDDSYPFAWMTSANLNTLVKNFSQEDLNLLRNIIAKVCIQVNKRKK